LIENPEREGFVGDPLGTQQLSQPCLVLAVEGARPMINEVTDMLHRAPLTTPTTLSEKTAHDISKALIPLLSDVFALYLKTKNFHWHMSGSHFRDYHLMLDDQGDQLFSMTDAIAE
jgi:hypothetical protein